VSSIALAGAVATVVGVILTLVVTTRGETKRQGQRLKAEEARLLHTEGRAALASFLAAATAFDHASTRPGHKEDEIRRTIADLDLAMASVLITCSTEIAERATLMGSTAHLYAQSDNATVEHDRRVEFQAGHLVRAARDELGLNEPKPGEE